MGARVIGIGRGYGDSVGAVDLVKGHEPGGWMYGGDCAPAVFGDCGAIVARAEAHVQAGQYAGGNAATPTEKAVRNGSKRSGTDHFDTVGHRFSLISNRCALANKARVRPAP